jgi:hypothetical protein
MARQIGKLIDGEWRWFDEGDLRARRISEPRVHIATDSMPSMHHPINGRNYDSKSAFRAVTKAHGCIEMGNDRIESRSVELSREERRDDIAKAINQNEWKN